MIYYSYGNGFSFSSFLELALPPRRDLISEALSKEGVGVYEKESKMPALWEVAIYS